MSNESSTLGWTYLASAIALMFMATTIHLFITLQNKNEQIKETIQTTNELVGVFKESTGLLWRVRSENVILTIGEYLNLSDIKSNIKDHKSIPQKDLLFVVCLNGERLPIAYFDKDGLVQSLIVRKN